MSCLRMASDCGKLSGSRFCVLGSRAQHDLINKDLSVKAVIICSPDEYANGVKPRELVRHLRGRGYEVDIFSSAYLSRAGKTGFAAVLVSALAFYLRSIQHEFFALIHPEVDKCCKREEAGGEKTKWQHERSLWLEV